MNPRPSSPGFSLVEVTIAMGLAAFCLVALFGLLPIGVNSDQAAQEQTAAVNLATAIVADLRANPTGTASPQFGFVRPAATPNPAPSPQTVYVGEDGAKILAGNTTTVPRYRVTVWCTPPKIVNTTFANKTATNVRLMVTWPGTVDRANNAATPTRYSGAFETVVALDRN